MDFVSPRYPEIAELHMYSGGRELENEDVFCFKVAVVDYCVESWRVEIPESISYLNTSFQFKFEIQLAHF